MIHPIDRAPGLSPKRSQGSAYGGVASAVATADDKTAGTLDQARTCFAKIDRTLEALGSSSFRLIGVTIYLADIADKAMLDQAWNEWIGDDSTQWPQRCCVGAALAGGTRVEVLATAARDD